MGYFAHRMKYPLTREVKKNRWLLSTWGRGDVGTWGRGDVGTWGRGDVLVAGSVFPSKDNKNKKSDVLSRSPCTTNYEGRESLIRLRRVLMNDTSVADAH